MSEENANAEAHLIGSLIHSLSSGTEDDVFFTSNTPHSTLPLPDSLLNENFSSTMNKTMMEQNVPAQFYANKPPPHPIPTHHILRPAQPFWTPSTPHQTIPIQGRLPHPLQQLAHNSGHHGRWIPPPHAIFGQTPIPANFSPVDIQQFQQYQAFLAYQQQQQQGAYEFQQGLVRHPHPILQQQRRQFQNEQTAPVQSMQQSDQNDQWESIYTPFGPVRGPPIEQSSTAMNAQNRGVVDDSVSGRFHHGDQQYSISDMDFKKRSSSLSSPSTNATSPNQHQTNEQNSNSTSSSAPRTTSCSTTASSPSLPPKGRSYRDVAKSKTESKSGGAHVKKSASEAGSQGTSPNGIDPSTTEITSSSSVPSRKFSAPARESSSDSFSEFGGSESGATKFAVVENFVAGFLDKRHGNSEDNEKRGKDENNVLKKNATTTMATIPGGGDFQKIIRRKGSQTKLLTGRDQSPVVAGTSRYAILSKQSPTKLESKETDPIHQHPVISSGAQDRPRVKLNNEQAATRFGSKSPTRKAAYINNDLTWPGRAKSTNKKNENGDWMDYDDEEANTPAIRKQSIEDQRDESDEDLMNDEEDEQQGTQRKGDGEIGCKNRKKTLGSNLPAQKCGTKKGKAKRGESGDSNKKRRQQRGVIMRWINLVLTVVACYVRDAAVWLVNLVTDIGHQLWDITLYCSKSSWIKISTSSQHAWYSTGERLKRLILCIRQKEWSILLWWRARRKNRGDNDHLGLEENIELPNTGEEALKRLLSCQGQDAYSILGLRPDCTDDEVKCYYRRQAILVHPDKNACCGADEAFKILAAAFEMIGTPERRRAYDLQNLHRTKAMQELQEMLSKLREKVEEIRSTMQCDCGGKHKRFPTERELAYARYCRKCGEKHHAREGDIWAESHWFGFLWYYYACMDGVVYDITEWAGCQKNNLKHMKPDTHLVQYRLITGRNARQFHQQQQSSTGLQSSSSNGGGHQQQQYGNQQQFNRSASQPDGTSNANNTSAEDALNRYWDDRLSSKNASGASSMYLLPGGQGSSMMTSTNFGGLSGVDFAAPTQSKFNPPSCQSHGDTRPRKAGRRRKPRV